MQSIDGEMNPTDESCIDLLDIINMDDNSPILMPDTYNAGQKNNCFGDIGDLNEDDRCYQEIMSALEKKDFQRIATLALSQSQGGQQMGAILNKTMLAMETGKKTTTDTNEINKITSIIRAQPKNISSVLRATVAPIRNESIVSSASSTISNYVPTMNNHVTKSTSQVSQCSTTQDLSDPDWNEFLSSDGKSGETAWPIGDQSHQETSRVLASHLSSSYMSQNSVDHWSYANADFNQGYQYQHPQAAPMPFLQLNNQTGTMMLAGNYGAQSQMQYPSSFISNNGIVCIVTPNMPGDNGPNVQNLYSTNMPLLNNNPNMKSQNMHIFSQQNLSLASSCPVSSESPRTTTSTISTSTHGPTLARILPKPLNRIIAPRTNYSQQYIIQPSQTVSQPFKRLPANKRTTPRPKSSKASRCGKAKDNIMMAWEIAEQSLPCEDQSMPNQSYLMQLEVDGENMQINREMEVLLGGYDNASNVESKTDSPNIFAGLEELFESLNETKFATVTVHEAVVSGSCIEYVTQYSYVQSFCSPPLARAIVTTSPTTLQSVTCKNIATEETLWPTVSDTHMVQLLYAHLGRHSDLLSPLLKCFLPPGSNDLLCPLSVSTRMSEQEDQMNEEDLLEESSPVKRDPSMLANLDKLLESCQPPSSVKSTWSSECSTTDRGQICMPFHNAEDPLTLQSFTKNSGTLSWLRRGINKNKWMIKGAFVKNSRAIEVPKVSLKVPLTILRKRSNYQNSVFKQTRILVARTDNEKYRRHIRLIKQINKVKREEDFPLSTNRPEKQHTTHHCESSSGLKIRIHVSRSSPAVVSTINDKVDSISKVSPQNTDERSTIPPFVFNNDPIQRTTAKIDSIEPITTQVDYIQSLIQKIDSIPPIVLNDDVHTARTASLNTANIIGESTLTNSNDETRNLKRHSKSSNGPKVKKPRRKRSKSIVRHHSRLSKQHKRKDSSTKGRHEQVPPLSFLKEEHSPDIVNRSKDSVKNPPLILKLCAKMSDSPVGEDHMNQTSNTIKLLLNRKGHGVYTSQVSTMRAMTPGGEPEETYQYNAAVNLPPLDQYRARPQQAALQFSPTQSSSDSDVGLEHNEISFLLKRQEQREPLSSTPKINSSTFPLLPVPYLIGNDPIVFMDPHEVELVAVKNSRYKKASRREKVVCQPIVNARPESGHGNVLVPGCYMEQEKATAAWGRSSPMMPILAPQEPVTGAGNTAKSSHSPRSGGMRSDRFSDQADQIQQSPLCMVTNHQYTSSSQINLIPPDPRQSPFRYPYQTQYDSSCYLGDTVGQSLMPHSQTQSPHTMVQTSTMPLQLPDYSYFHGHSQEHMQSMAGLDRPLFAGHSSANSYQSPSEPHATKSSSEKPKDPSTLSMYPSGVDPYSSAAQYPGFDYYGSGFSEIFDGMEQMKMYEQYARQLGSMSIPWGSAVAEYCKQAAAQQPQSSTANPPDDYSNPYSAYAMSQPYSMYSSFGTPK